MGRFKLCAYLLYARGGNIERAECRVVEGGVDLVLYLPAEVPGEARQRNREVMFALDAHEDVSFIVANLAAASTFQLGEQVLIKSGAMTITLKITLDSGDGQFFWAYHQRESHLAKAYDWRWTLQILRLAALPTYC
jgi:hypothetical protein